MPITASVVGIVAGLAGIGTEIYALANQPSAPKAPTQTQSNIQQAQAQQASALAQAQELSKRRGLASTILTSPMGASSGPAQTQTATLGT